MVLECTYYNASKGQGFLRCVESGQSRLDCFVHVSNIKDQINLRPGDIVTGDVIKSTRCPGRLDATNVVLRKRDEVAQ